MKAAVIVAVVIYGSRHGCEDVYSFTWHAGSSLREKNEFMLLTYYMTLRAVIVCRALLSVPPRSTSLH